MSENMQSGRFNGRKPRKVALGRLRLSTACSECHRRKQKCDRGHPCRNCARRYPQPDCIYLHIPDPGFTPSSSHVSSPSSLGRAGSTSTSHNESTRADSRSPWPSECNVRDTVTESSGQVSPSLDDLDVATSYQMSLSAMIKSNEGTLEDLDTSEIGQNSHRGRGVSQDYCDEVGDHNEDQNIAIVERRASLSSNQQAPIAFNFPSVDPLHYLPISPSSQNGKLFHAFVNVITKFVVSIDGNPSPNYYNDQWIPWSIKSPLLAQIGLFTAANYQAEARKTPAAQSRVAIGHKVQAISMLNEMLRSPRNEEATCDEAVAAVIYFITHEWYWGSKESVEAHMSGLQDMIRLRGGLESGMTLFLRQMIILCDYHIAISYEQEPRFQHHLAALTSQPTDSSYPPHLDSPLLPSSTNFSEHSAVPINAETCRILDDIRFLTTSIFQETSSSRNNIEKIHLLSHWILSRLTALPTTTSPSTPLPTANIYKSTLFAAQIYARAINERKPLSAACTVADLNQLWGSMWRVTLTQWKRHAGIFIWILLVVNPAARETGYGRLVKSLLKSACFYAGLEEWDTVDGMLGGWVGVQRWLRGALGELEEPSA